MFYVFYCKPSPLTRTYPQNYRRNEASVRAETLEDAHRVVQQLRDKGETVLCIRTAMGRRINL